MTKKKNSTSDMDAIENLEGFSIGADVKVTDLITTGHPELDQAISGDLCTDGSGLKGGGFPLGKLVMLYGNEGGGKSSLAYRMVGAAQRKGYRCAWIDTEHSFSEQLAKVNGCDVSKLFYSNLEDINSKRAKKEDEESILSGELVMQKMIDAIQSGKINVIVLDSVASLVPEQVLRKDVNEDTMATLARIMAKSMPKIAAYAQQHDVLVIFINQLREKIGDAYGTPHTFPGGRALRHQCSTVIKVMKEASREKNEIHVTNDEGEQVLVGRYSFASIEKNRFNRPATASIRVPIYYEQYFPDLPSTLFEVGRYLKIIRVRMNVYSWHDIKAEGKTAFLAALELSGKIAELVDHVREEAKDQKYPLPIEVINYRTEADLSTADSE
jgi:recombination protein RecA